MRRVVTVSFLIGVAGVGLAARQFNFGPDAAVGSVEERLASAIVFDSTGTFEPGQGFTAHVRLSWQGSAALKARVVYGEATPATLLEHAYLDGARSAFYNFAVTGARVVPGPAVLPAAVEYDVREAMSFGKGGKVWGFYVPVPRVMYPIPPAGQLAVGDVGRWTTRARYTLAAGMHAEAPIGRRLDTDFATFASSYTVDGRDVVLERSVQLKTLTLPLEREAELRAFYRAVEDDRRLTFAIAPYPPGGATAADRLNEQGLSALEAQDPQRAADQFRQAIAADPVHRWATFNLANAQLGMKDARAAIESSRRGLAADAGNAYARLTLGQALEAAGEFPDAEKILLEQVERLPWSAWSLDALAQFYLRRQRPADAVRYWQRSVAAAPRDEPTLLALGRTLLDLGRTAEASEAWRKGLAPTRDALVWNSAAWMLAERGVELEAASEMVQRGLDLAARNSLAPAPVEATARQEATRQLAALWDTAGWVAFKSGRFEDASGWLHAAWQQSEEAEVAEHLGDALVALKRGDDAARAYADALALEPGRATVTAKLAAIPEAPKPDLATSILALARARTVSLEPGPVAAWTGRRSRARSRRRGGGSGQRRRAAH